MVRLKTKTDSIGQFTDFIPRLGIGPYGGCLGPEPMPEFTGGCLIFNNFMISTKDFFRIEGVPNQHEDKFYVRELCVNSKIWTRSKRYKWLYVTDDYPTDDVKSAKIFAYKDAVDFIDEVNRKSLDLE